MMVVLFSVVLPLILILAVMAVDIGNWFVHARHLQTKVDAAAFAGGGVWGFPCGAPGGTIDARIETEARKYVGEHVQADNTPFTATTFNPQVGQTPGSLIHVVLNGSGYWDDDEGSAPLDRTLPLNPSICASQTLDVKATEENNIGLFRFLPFFPDIKRKARIRIEEVDGLTGLLPIGVRLPQPLSAAAVFYDEETKEILDVQAFRQVCTPTSPGGCIFGMPPGLGHWTTAPGADPTEWARIAITSPRTGVVIATSVRPQCGAGEPPAGPPCLNASESLWKTQSVDDFCRQASGAVQCFDADGNGTTQTVQSGVHFIRGYGNAPVGAGPPAPRSAFLTTPTAGCSPYFNSSTSTCHVPLTVRIDLGSVLEDIPPTPPDEAVETRKAGNVEVRYRLVRADGTSYCDYGANCALQTGNPDATGTVEFSTQGTTSSPHLPITPGSRGNAVAIEIRLGGSSATPNPGGCGPGNDPNNLCRWFYTAETVSPSVPPTDAEILAAPIQRSFMGDLDRTGPLKWLRLTVDTGCDPDIDDWLIGGGGIPYEDAASQPGAPAERCYFVEMGMAGGLARDQDEPPIALNLGSGSSQRALIDCDPDIANLKDEILFGCRRPSYSANKFDTTPVCPGTAGFFSTPPPVQGWPPYRCVLTQPTAAANQIIQGFNERIFGRSNNPTCPDENVSGYPPPTGQPAPWTRGRNYWHRENNVIDDYTFAWDVDTSITTDDWGNRLRSDDPRLVTLFFTTYDSFTSPGNDVYPVVGFGTFYITGYGRTGPGGWQGGGPDDPCGDGSDSAVYEYAGNDPPPDIDFSKNTTWVWGHFVKDVTPAPLTTGGSGVGCNPEASFQPCVPVLVE